LPAINYDIHENTSLLHVNGPKGALHLAIPTPNTNILMDGIRFLKFSRDSGSWTMLGANSTSLTGFLQDGKSDQFFTCTGRAPFLHNMFLILISKIV
jgi:hypothetical protein